MESQESRILFNVDVVHEHAYMKWSDYNRIKNGDIMLYWNEHADNTQIRFIVHYKHNHIDGMITRFFSDGEIYSSMFVKDGQLVYRHEYCRGGGLDIHEHDSCNHHVTQMETGDGEFFQTTYRINGVIYNSSYFSWHYDKFSYSDLRGNSVRFSGQGYHERLTVETEKNFIIYDPYGFRV